MDRRIEVKVFGNHLWKDGNRAGVQGEGNVTTLRISFDEGWDEYAKSVTFFDAKGRNPVKRVLGVDLLEDAADNTLVYLCKIPPEPLTEAGWCSFIIEGYIDEARQRSVETQLEVMPARETGDAVVPGAPTPTQAEQLRGEIQKIKDDVQKAAQGAQSAELAGQYAAAAAESAEQAQSDAQSAEESARAAEDALNQMGDDAAAAAASAAAAQESENAAATSAKAAQDAQTGAEKAKYAVENLEVDAVSVPSGMPAYAQKSVNTEKEVLAFRFGIPKGVSPTVEVTAYEEVENWGDINIIRSGHDVAITDEEGTKTFRVPDGRNGADGKDGSVWVPLWNSEGNLSWKKRAESDFYPEPDPVDIVQMVLDAMPEDGGGETIPGPGGSVDFDTSGLLDKATYDPQGKQTDIFQYVDQKVASVPVPMPDVAGAIGLHNVNTDAHADIREIAHNAASIATSAKSTADNALTQAGFAYDEATSKASIFYCYSDSTELWEIDEQIDKGNLVVLNETGSYIPMVFADYGVTYLFRGAIDDSTVITATIDSDGWTVHESSAGGTADADNYGTVKLSSSVTSYEGENDGVAATPIAVKNAYDEARAARQVADGKANSSHTQAASTITAGTFAGQVVANASGQTPGTSLLRNSKLVSADTAPTINGEICWTYK